MSDSIAVRNLKVYAAQRNTNKNALVYEALANRSKLGTTLGAADYTTAISRILTGTGSGYSAYSGYSGALSGFSGRSGYSGFSGTSGYSGRSGYSAANSGYSGISGNSGVSGYSGF